MSHRDHLLYMLTTVQQVVKPLIDDITEEESLVRGPDTYNHIRWQTGHLAHGDSYALTLLGDESEDCKKYESVFEAGIEISKDPAVYPPMAQLREWLYRVHDKGIARVKNIDEADLEKKIGEGDRKRPVWQILTFYCLHEFYHAGQITQVRKSLGRPRPFM